MKNALSMTQICVRKESPFVVEKKEMLGGSTTADEETTYLPLKKD
jgi:hypothetical protein